jgi:hypothetical protein
LLWVHGLYCPILSATQKSGLKAAVPINRSLFRGLGQDD